MLTAAALLDLAKNLRAVRTGTATGGSATTLVDTNLVENNDWFNGGTIWLLSGNNAGKTAKITDWASSTFTFTFPTLTLLCAATDRYAVVDSMYSKELLLQALNEALQSIGPFTQSNTALTTVADQEAYTLPAGVYNVARVEIAGSLTSPYEYWVYRYAREQNGTLYLNELALPDAGYKMRLWYDAPHSAVANDTDVISDEFHPDLIKAIATVKALSNRMGYTSNSEPNVAAALKEAQQMEQLARVRYPIRRTRQTSRLPVWPQVVR